MPRISGVRSALRALTWGSALALGGCYGFAGGGLPPGIRTVAILPFENLTPDPTLTLDIQAAVQNAVQGRLGLRPAGEATADAVVRGVISRYEPDLPVAYQGTQSNQVDVTRRLVQITVSVEIVNRRDGRTIWQRAGLMVDGDYQTGQEAEGRRKALDKLTTTIVEGAQSQW